MSNKIWTVKYSSYGRRSRYHRGKGFPRTAMKYYEGNHLSMRKRMMSKSNFDTAWGYRDGSDPYIQRKYIVGLLYKFVDKPYSKFMKAFTDRAKHLLKKYHIHNTDINYFLDSGGQLPKYSDPKFHVDGDGIIRKDPDPKRRRFLTSNLIYANRRVQIPNFGQARDEQYGPLKERFRKPILLGEFYVRIGNHNPKVPVYTLGNAEDKDSKDWVKVELQGPKKYQEYYISVRNDVVETYEKVLQDTIKNHPEDTATINYMEKALRSMPEFVLKEVGYGWYYPAIKREEYEKWLKSS